MAPVTLTLCELNKLRGVLQRLQIENLLPLKKTDFIIDRQSLIVADLVVTGAEEVVAEGVVLDYREADRLLCLLRMAAQAYADRDSSRDPRFVGNMNYMTKQLEMSIFVSQMGRSHFQSSPPQMDEDADEGA